MCKINNTATYHQRSGKNGTLLHVLIVVKKREREKERERSVERLIVL